MGWMDQSQILTQRDQYTETDILDYLTQFEEFEDMQKEMRRLTISADSMQQLRTKLDAISTKSVEAPLDDAAIKMLIIDLYRHKTRTNKQAFRNTVYQLLLHQFKPIKERMGGLTIKNLAKYCLEKMAEVRGQTAPQTS